VYLGCLAGSGASKVNVNDTYPTPGQQPPAPFKFTFTATVGSQLETNGGKPFNVDPDTGVLDQEIYQQFYTEYHLFLAEGLDQVAGVNGTATTYMVGPCEGLCVERGTGGPYCLDELKRPCTFDQSGYNALGVLKRASHPALPLDLGASIQPPSPAPKGRDSPDCQQQSNFYPWPACCK